MTAQGALSGPLDTGLRRNSLRAVDVIAMCAATYAPTAALYFNTPLAASFAGPAIPLAYLLATVGVLAVAVCMAQLAARLATAGGYYEWVRVALGPTLGLLVGWLVLLGPFMVLPAVYVATGNYTATVLSRYGLDLHWYVIALILIVLVTGVNAVGIRPSVRIGLAILVIEVLILLALALVIVARGGSDGNTGVPFDPRSAGSLSGLGGAMVFGVLSYIGFEAVATTGEEASRPGLSIPVALVLGIVIGGVFFTFVSYAEAIGFGVRHLDKLVGNAAPFDTLGQRYGNPLLRAGLDVAGVTSNLASLILTTVAVTRIGYAMGRDRLLPPAFATTSPRFRTPVVAIAAQAVLCIAVVTVLGFWLGPGNTFGYLGTLLTFTFLLVYALIMAATIVAFRTALRRHFRPLLHVALPVLGILICVYPFWALSPLGGPQPPPYNWLPLVFLAYTLVGLVLGIALRSRLGRVEAMVARLQFDDS